VMPLLQVFYQNFVCIYVLFFHACPLLSSSHLYFIILNTHIFGEEYKSLGYSLCSSVQPHVTPGSCKYLPQHSINRHPPCFIKIILLHACRVEMIIEEESVL
jgi:hypothetical protein